MALDQKNFRRKGKEGSGEKENNGGVLKNFYRI